MTREEYIKISQISQADKTPLLYQYYLIKVDGNILIKDEVVFNNLIFLWIQIMGLDYETLVDYVITQLDKHFKIND